ncbi:MAG: universal stress protein [Solirubrobacteraceae bacterium]
MTVGPPADALQAFGDQVDLLVVGSRGHGTLRRLLLGSKSAHLARNARCPLLVLPHGRARRRPRGAAGRDDHQPHNRAGDRVGGSPPSRR